MTISKNQVPTFSKSQPRIQLEHKSIDDRDKLIAALQRAAIVEFSTIPPYLTALYSIKDKSTQAYQTLRSVVLEEMLHLNLVSNLMNSIGGSPKFIDEQGNLLVPSYPSYIFNNKPPSGPYVQLMVASPELMHQVFMAIEKPAPYNAPPEDEKLVTIGQFYKAIEKGFENCVEQYGEEKLFSHNTGFQRDNLYFGSGGGKPILVKDLKTAREAINQIVQQGEGANPPKQEYQSKQEWGTYNYYGLRSDGTYGPILGTPLDLSHYFKFKDLADGTIPIGETYPMLPNPSPEKFESEWTKKLAELFNDCYGLMLTTLQVLFGSKTEPDPYFTVIVPLMQSIFPTLATQLMQLPVLEEGDPNLGPNAGPCFQYSSITLDDIVCKVEKLKEQLDAATKEKASLRPIAATLSTVHNTFKDIDDKTPAKSSLRRCLCSLP